MTKLTLDFSLSPGDVPEADFYAAVDAATKQYFFARTQQGHTYPQPSVEDLVSIVSKALDCFHKNGTVGLKLLIDTYAELAGHDERWSARTYRNAQEKKMGLVLDQLRSHEVLQWLAEADLLTPTHEAGLKKQPLYNVVATICQNARVAVVLKGLREELAVVVTSNASQADAISELRGKWAVSEERLRAMEVRVQLLEADRAWQVDALRLRAEGKSLRHIAELVGKGKSTVADFLQRSIG